jgi:Na+-transporting NADH:ubiquinone oxidoreductase subunit NqrC
LTKEGKVKDIEILTYRETYGGQIRNPKWLAQFFGKDHTEILKLDKQIRNISGATLSCRHVTDGINRLTHTWDQVLRNL